MIIYIGVDTKNIIQFDLSSQSKMHIIAKQAILADRNQITSNTVILRINTIVGYEFGFYTAKNGFPSVI